MKKVVTFGEIMLRLAAPGNQRFCQANRFDGPEAIHRVATISTQTFDTLPFQGAVIVTLGLCGLTHKEGYFPVMMTTVIWTGAAAVVAALMLTFFPGLA